MRPKYISLNKNSQQLKVESRTIDKSSKIPSQQYFSKTDIDKNDLIQASSSKPSIAQKRFEKSLQKAVQFLLNKSRTP